MGLRRGSKGSRRGPRGISQRAKQKQQTAARLKRQAAAVTTNLTALGGGDIEFGRKIQAVIDKQKSAALTAAQKPKVQKVGPRRTASQQIFAARRVAKNVGGAASREILAIGFESPEQEQALRVAAGLAAKLANLERQKATILANQAAVQASAARSIAQRREAGRLGQTTSTKQLNRALAFQRNIAIQTGKQLKSLDSQIAFAKVETGLRQKEAARFAAAIKAVGPLSFAVQPRSVAVKIKGISAQLRKLTKLRRSAGVGDIRRQFEIDKQINNLRIQSLQTLAREGAKFKQVLEGRRVAAVRTSRQQAVSAGIKQSEARAVAASQGIAIGTIRTGAAGTQIASIVTPKGQRKEVVLPTTAALLAKTPIEKLPEPTARGGKAIQVELAETLTFTDKITKQKINKLGGVDLNLQLGETLGFSDIKKPKPVDKITAAIAAQTLERQPIIPKEDIAGKDIAVDIATGQVTEQIRLTAEAERKRQAAATAEIAEGQLFFPTPQALALGVPTQIAKPKEVKVVDLIAGEQITPEQIIGATKIVQAGPKPTKELTQPVKTFFDNITSQVKSFTKEQEVIAQTSENIVERGLATIGAGAGKIGESLVGAAAVVPLAIREGAVKKGLEQTQDALFNIVTVQKQIAERGTDPIERGLANVASFGAEASRQIVGDVAFALNISQQLSREGRRASIQPQKTFDFFRAVTTPLPAEQEIAVPATLANVAIGEGVGGIFAAGTGTELGAAFGPAQVAIGAAIESRGLAAGIGSVFALALPFNPKALVPFRVVKVLGTTGKIVRTLQPTRISTAVSPVKNILGKTIKETDAGILAKRVRGGEIGVKEVLTPETVSLGRTLVFGRGGAKSVGLLSRTSEGFVLGDPTRTQRGTKAVVKFVEQIEPIGRGFELGTGGFATKVLTQPKVATAKIIAGKATPAGVEATELSKELAKLIIKTPKAKQQKFLSATEQLTQTVEAGKESEALAKIISKLPASKGGFGQSFLVIGERARKDIDIDFASLFRGEAKAIKAAEKAQVELTIAARRDPTRKFTVSFSEGGPKLKSVGGTLGDQEKKVIEFLTKRDAADVGQLDSLGIRGGEFFGEKFARGTTKIKLPFEQGAKVDTLQGQAFKKLASSLSEQGPQTESAIAAGGKVEFLKEGLKDLSKTEKGFRVGPPDFRLKDLVDLFGKGQIVETLAATSRTAGKTKLGDDLLRLNTKFKKLFPDVDFGAVSKQADVIEFGNIGKSQVGSAAALRKAGSGVREILGPAIPTGIGQVAKGSITAAKAENIVGTNIKKNIDISVSSPVSKRTFDSIATIVSRKPSATTSKALRKGLDDLGSIAKPSTQAGTIENSLTSLAEIGKRKSLVQQITQSPADVSVSSPSLLKGLDSIGSIPKSVPSKTTSLGIPKTDDLDFASIGSTQISSLNKIVVKSPSITSPPSKPSKPVGSLPSAISPPLISSPPSRPSVPSVPSVPSIPALSPPKIPTGRAGSPSAALVFGKSVPKKPPIVPRGLLLNLLSGKDRVVRRKLPTFTKALRFIADPADPLRAGVFSAKGVSQLVSGKASVFKTIDKQLAAARQAKGAVVPLGERIGIERARIGLGPIKKPKRVSKKVKAQRKAQNFGIQRKGLI